MSSIPLATDLTLSSPHSSSTPSHPVALESQGPDSVLEVSSSRQYAANLLRNVLDIVFARENNHVVSVKGDHTSSLGNQDGPGKDNQRAHDQSLSDEREESRYRRVRLEFLSPADDRLMGSLTYCIPLPVARLREAEEVNKQCDQIDIEESCGTGSLLQTRVDDLELEFRKSSLDFATSFDDRDTTDELAPELLRLSTKMQTKCYESSRDRCEVTSKLHSELARQDSLASLAAEESQILGRLKEVAAAKRASKQALAVPSTRAPRQRRSSAKARSTSGEPPSAGRARRTPSRPRLSSKSTRTSSQPTPTLASSRARRTSKPTRKVIVISDDEDDEHVDVVRPETIDDADEKGSVEFIPAPAKNADVVEVLRQVQDNEDDDFLVILPRPKVQNETHENSSAATTPSSETGDPSESVRSPVGIFPRETDDGSHVGRIPSPVSPLMAATPKKPDLNVEKAKVAVVAASPELAVQKGSTCS